jgi:hypothetical protein
MFTPFSPLGALLSLSLSLYLSLSLSLSLSPSLSLPAAHMTRQLPTPEQAAQRRMELQGLLMSL